MITAEMIKEMVRLEVRRVIFEELTLEYDSPHYVNDNILRVDLMLGDEVVSSIHIGEYDIPKIGRNQ
ncbi:hypothetical protein pzkkv8_216 [Klebsiella phage pzk-kv8]|jgi:hypothetical protein|nr:hypothetical protein pzkkv8_216 [Klebsiella phage pzk-kv8]